MIEGFHLIEAYHDHHGIPELLVANRSCIQRTEFVELLDRWTDLDIVQLPDGLFRQLSDVATPAGILAVIQIPDAPIGRLEGSCVMLDAVQDSGNVGTILRTAAAANIHDVFLGRGCAYAWSPKVLRAAQGAHFGLHIHEITDIKGMLANYSGTAVATVARQGVAVFDLDLSGDIAWIFGNEGAGVGEDFIKLAGVRATIPVAAGTESLNVAAAAAVCLFEQVRQKRSTKGRLK